MSIFDGLKASLEEAVQIKRREQTASKESTFEVTDLQAVRTQKSGSQHELTTALDTKVGIVKIR